MKRTVSATGGSDHDDRQLDSSRVRRFRWSGAVAQTARGMEGKVMVLPTDAVYGIGVSVAHARTPDLIYGISDAMRARRFHGWSGRWMI